MVAAISAAKVTCLAARFRILVSSGAAARWGFCLATAAGFLLGLCGVCSADPVRLDYRVADTLDCPTELEFRAELRRRLGDDPFSEVAPRTVFVSIEATDAGPAGMVSWRDERGALPGIRRFEPSGQSCRALVTNIAFAVTVQIQLLRVETADEGEASAGQDGSEPAPSTTQSSAPSAAPVRGDDATAPATPDDGSVRNWSAGAGAMMVLGWSPQATLGARVFAVRRERWFALEAGAELTSPTRIERDDGSGFEISAWSGTVAPCLVAAPLSGCVVLRFGQVRASGFGVDRPRSPDALLSQVGARLALSEPLGEYVLASIYGELLGNLTRWRVELDRNQVWAAPAAAGVAGVALSASFF